MVLMMSYGPCGHSGLWVSGYYSNSLDLSLKQAIDLTLKEDCLFSYPLDHGVALSGENVRPNKLVLTFQDLEQSLALFGQP